MGDDKKFKEFFEKYLDENPVNINEAEHLDEGEEARSKNQKPKQVQNMTIDLHGMRVSEAINEIERKLLGLNGAVTVRIITGKGRHSSGEGVLVRDIYHFVTTRFKREIKKIDDPPAASMVGGLPLRGDFEVQLWL